LFIDLKCHHPVGQLVALCEEWRDEAQRLQLGPTFGDLTSRLLKTVKNRNESIPALRAYLAERTDNVLEKAVTAVDAFARKAARTEWERWA